MELPEDPSLGPDQELAKVYGKRLGRYELFFRLGTGGMATVYLGRLSGEIGFERWVAVKQIHEHLSEDRTFRDMFLDEARVAVQLYHPNLVQVTDIGVEEGRPYLVMEYVKGETLAHILKRCHRRNERLPPHVTARILAWACDGLHHAHELRDETGAFLGLVHRDLSPHNILISYDGVVKVADFGIAKAAGRVTHTRTGFIKGKPQYMSPEQALARDLDRRSDIFSLGILLWEATLGRRLFKEDSEYETFRRITEGDVPRPRALARGYPPLLEAIVMRALSVRPELRQSTARELQSDLEKFLVKIGRPVSTGELSEYMRALFQDRIDAHNELLAWARANPTEEPPKTPHLLLAQTRGSSSVSLRPPDAEEPPSALRQRQSRSPASTWTRLALVVAALATAVGVSALVVRLFAGPSGHPDSVDGGATDLIRSSTTPGSGSTEVDAGAPDGARPALGSVAHRPAEADGGRATDAEALIFPDAPDLVFNPSEVSGGAEEDGGASQRRRQPPRRRHPEGASGPQAEGQEGGMLSIMARPWCEVYLDGRHLGRTPLMSVEASAGRHTLLFLPRGERPGEQRSVQIRPGSLTPISIDLRQEAGDAANGENR